MIHNVLKKEQLVFGLSTMYFNQLILRLIVNVKKEMIDYMIF